MTSPTLYNKGVTMTTAPHLSSDFTMYIKGTEFTGRELQVPRGFTWVQSPQPTQIIVYQYASLFIETKYCSLP